MSENKDKFQYSYSAKQQEEIRKIRDKYISGEENKMEQLRRLDASAEKPGAILSLTLGIISMFLLGVGMCCTMIWNAYWFIPGVVIGVIGIGGIIAAYPLCRYITRRRREKLAPQILRLTDELSQQ